MSIQTDEHYWQNKLLAWLYYPVTKVFGVSMYRYMAESIRKVICNDFDSNAWHEKDGEKYLQFLKADNITSEMLGAALPTYSEDENQDGSVVFKDCAEVNHPLVGKKLEISLTESQKEYFSFDDSNDNSDEEKQKLADDFMMEITDILQKVTNDTSFKNISAKEEQFRYLFEYLFFAFSRKLRGGNIKELGALWDLLPADTRIPDHSIWNHTGLASAIFSSMKNKDDSNISLCVYSITPVQDFIGKARKLRDFWTGSVILSYLSFMGISHVMRTLGPDHIVYPSLQNQYLVDGFLKEEWKDFVLTSDLEESDLKLRKLNEQSSGIASFPNKFVFICNSEQAEDICNSISEHIQNEWLSLARIVKDYIVEKVRVNSAGSTFEKIWDNSIETFWKFSWAATSFLDIKDNKEIAEKLLTKSKYEKEEAALEKFCEYATGAQKHNTFSDAKMYGATHSLAHGLLAAGKARPVSIKNPEKGFKCPLCGEHEVLHNYTYEEKKVSASDYDEATKQFWKNLGDAVNHNLGKSEDEKEYIQIGKGERLCSVCAVKRLLPLALKEKQLKEHLLYNTLVKDVDSFPSTTSMASWLNTGSRSDKYYAFLLMDGDKMGDLVNGDSIEAKWNAVLSSELVARFEKLEFCKTSPFKKELKNEVRTINPALHAMISDSLNNFARYGVQPAFFDENSKPVGRLIYAGGDDVCAILPLKESFRIANEIRKTYTYSFTGIRKSDGKLEEIEGKLTDISKYSKIGMHLGTGAKKISISGAIIIAHHLQPLREVVKTAHSVLDGVAKTKSGRNSLAIRFMARSGGARDVWFNWEGQGLFGMKVREAFDYVLRNAGKGLSTSLLYGIENLNVALEPLAKDLAASDEAVKRAAEKNILFLFEYEIKHSGTKVTDVEKMAKALATICVISTCDKEHKNSWFKPDAAVIANFMAGAETELSEAIVQEDADD